MIPFISDNMQWITLVLIVLSAFFLGCTDNNAPDNLDVIKQLNTSVEIPDVVVDKSTLHYDNQVSFWTLNNELFTGYAVVYHQDSTLKEKAGFFNGKKQGEAITWYPGGQVLRIANYNKGKLHGSNKTWSRGEDHILISQLNYYQGKAHGEQRKWYPTGELYKVLQMTMGKEEGIQQAFRENGDLYANYEAKNGRIFGLKKAALCYGLEDQKIQLVNKTE